MKRTCDGDRVIQVTRREFSIHQRLGASKGVTSRNEQKEHEQQLRVDGKAVTI